MAAPRFPGGFLPGRFLRSFSHRLFAILDQLPHPGIADLDFWRSIRFLSASRPASRIASIPSLISWSVPGVGLAGDLLSRLQEFLVSSVSEGITFSERA